MTTADDDATGTEAAGRRAQAVLASVRAMSLTEANRLGIEQVMAIADDHPVKITKRGKTVGVLYSADDMLAIHTGVAQMNASALRLLAEMVERLSEPELWAMSTKLADLLDVPVDGEPR